MSRPDSKTNSFDKIDLFFSVLAYASWAGLIAFIVYLEVVYLTA